MDLNDKEGVRVKDTDLVIPDEGVDDVGMGTVDDRRDMLRLGKVQELRVCDLPWMTLLLNLILIFYVPTIAKIERFQLLVNVQLRDDYHGDMGNYTVVRI